MRNFVKAACMTACLLCGAVALPANAVAEDLVVNENYPGLKPHENGYHYVLEGDLVSPENGDITVALNRALIVRGDVRAEYDLKLVSDLEVNGSVEAMNILGFAHLISDGDVTANGEIYLEAGVVAKGVIRAESIRSDSSIQAGEGIIITHEGGRIRSVYGNINAGAGPIEGPVFEKYDRGVSVSAGRNITATSIKAYKLKADGSLRVENDISVLKGVQVGRTVTCGGELKAGWASAGIGYDYQPDPSAPDITCGRVNVGDLRHGMINETGLNENR